MGNLFLWGGITVGLWAVYEMRRSKLRIQPEVASGAILITTGPYRYIRNPMYFAVLSMTFGWLVDRPVIWRLSLWLGLIVVLVLKTKFEETLLKSAFADYPNYALKTKRLIPLIW